MVAFIRDISLARILPRAQKVWEFLSNARAVNFLRSFVDAIKALTLEVEAARRAYFQRICVSRAARRALKRDTYWSLSSSSSKA